MLDDPYAQEFHKTKSYKSSHALLFICLEMKTSTYLNTKRLFSVHDKVMLASL